MHQVKKEGRTPSMGSQCSAEGHKGRTCTGVSVSTAQGDIAEMTSRFGDPDREDLKLDGVRSPMNALVDYLMGQRPLLTLEMGQL
jgi:hypothetical protein